MIIVELSTINTVDLDRYTIIDESSMIDDFSNILKPICPFFCSLHCSLPREIIKETPEDMFTFLPPKKEFLKEFRNPCWKGRDLDNEEKLFCIPYFYIIGFTKCGACLFSIPSLSVLLKSLLYKLASYQDTK